VTDEAFVLVHSPVVGPLTWAGTAEALGRHGHRALVPALRIGPDDPPPYWAQLADRVTALAGSAIGSVTLVAHSGAGPLLPAIDQRLAVPVRCCVFVDATLPARSGSTPVVPPQFLGQLRDLARDGRLPRWSEWWGPQGISALVPDEALRHQVESEMPSLPLAVLEESVHVPEGWPRSRCGYLQFSEVYTAEAAEARSRGWPVTTLPGGHLHMLVDPEAVAQAIIGLAAAPSVSPSLGQS
jgi:hypothetical protein